MNPIHQPPSPVTGKSAIHVGTMRVDESCHSRFTADGRRAFLNVIRSKADLGVHEFINGTTVLGRDPDCSFPLQDYKVSRQHAAIKAQDDGTFVLRDLGSTNGTRVNGAAVTNQVVLPDGAKIFVGETVLRFSLADEVDVDFHSEVATLVGEDPLTGLPSKRRFDQAFHFAIQAAAEVQNPLAMLMMDMDGVKAINDTHGHLFGAYVIGETGRLISNILGNTGYACRFGGDEFSAFLPDLDIVEAGHKAEQIRAAVEGAGFQKDGIELKPTISIGIADYPTAGDDLTTITAAADEALYRAKERGKNRVCT